MKVGRQTEIMEVLPERKIVYLEGLYLGHNLHRVSESLGKTLVYANYISDLDDVIAVKDSDGLFQVPKALKNPDDWRLFQELEAQADVTITSRAYLRRIALRSDRAQNVLMQFETGNEFEKLGEWRLQHGFKSRSPDVAIVGRRLDFIIPESVIQSGRKIIIFTTYEMANSADGKRLEDLGIVLVGSGVEGVEGKSMIDYLATQRGYRTIYMVTGPSVVKILLDAKVLDRLYLTQIHRKISADDPASVKKILHNGKKVSELGDFVLTKKYLQDKVVTEDHTITSQEFLLYEKIQSQKREVIWHTTSK